MVVVIGETIINFTGEIMANKYLTPEEAARYLKRAPNTLKVWRSINKGPSFIKDKGGKIWYDEKALLDFIEGR